MGLVFLGIWFCQDPGDRTEFHPPLIARPLVILFNHALKIAHIMKLELTFLQADKGAPLSTSIALIDQEIQAQPSKTGGLDAVKGRWITALLLVA